MCIGHGILLLIRWCPASDPDVDLLASVSDEHVAGVESATRDGTFRHEGELEAATLVAEPEQRGLEVGVILYDMIKLLILWLKESPSHQWMVACDDHVTIMWSDVYTHLLLLFLNIIIREVAVEFVVGTNLTLICSRHRRIKDKNISLEKVALSHTEALNTGLAPSLRLQIKWNKIGVSSWFLWWPKCLNYTILYLQSLQKLNSSKFLILVAGLAVPLEGAEQAGHMIYIVSIV